jgi:hypothetical protein
MKRNFHCQCGKSFINGYILENHKNSAKCPLFKEGSPKKAGEKSVKTYQDPYSILAGLEKRRQPPSTVLEQ